ncbi:unnamed protein product [Ceutorhynchus assimilis]|uniref:cyclin-dependent kinase n=1 Tax=Ceutorhynchus assimilis TaxID=467358 RepID=A0A9N9QJU4_9CUCU|nr:unnamed protein product [Ceutorhynchus assimilis]
MSGTSSEDDQSEDEELRRSPITHSAAKVQKMDYQSEEDDGGDSLNIKPPQARTSDHRSKRRDFDKLHHRLPDRSDRKRDSRHGHKDKHRREKSSRYQTKDKEHHEHERDRYYREKQHSYEQMGYTEQQYLYERAFRERKSEEARARQERKYKGGSSKHGRSQNRDSRSDRNRKERRSDDTRASKALADLRERLTSELRLIEKRKSEDAHSHDMGHTKEREFIEVDDNLGDTVKGEASSYVREITLTSEARDYRKEKDKEFERYLTEEEKLEREQRREKLLEAEREMARLKERTKADRERRHIERAIKRKQEAEEEDSHKRILVYAAQQVVEVSDTSDQGAEGNAMSEKSESEPETAASGRSRSRSYSRSASKSSSTRSRSRSYSHEDSFSSGKSDRSRTKSRSRSASRSSSRSNSGSSSSSERSASRSRSRSKSRSPEEDEMLRNKDVKGANPQKIDKDLPPYYPAVQGCRSVEEFQCLNRIEEGTYGVVYRAKDKRTDEIVALKRLKMEKEKEGFPITSLREINTLLKGQHNNIVTVREIVMGSNMDKIFIVMDYVEHDLKSLLETMRHKKQHFMPGEVKCLLKQLLQAVAHLHDNWILHRDLKTSNLLLSHKGILKVGDFGLAREYGSPLKAYTPVVVTLWYRAPELLLCTKEYSTPIDVWSVGCIFAEFLLMNALFPGKSEVDQLNRIFRDLGTPSEKIWKGFNNLPAVKKIKFNEYPVSNLRAKFKGLSETGLGLLLKFLTYDPHQRITAEDALKHSYFTEPPLPIDPAMFPTWPAKSELGHKRAMAASPKPPSGGGEYKKLGGEDDDYGFRLGMGADLRRGEAGFTLKF